MPPLPDVRPDDPHVDPRRILRLFRPYTGRLVLVGLLIAASSLVGLGSPFLLRGIIDNALPHKDTGLLALLALGMVGVAVVSTVVGVYQTLLSTTIGQRIMRDLRVSVYAHLQRMSLAFFTKTRTGEVQSRIANDIGGMQAIVTSTATSIVSNATVVVASASPCSHGRAAGAAVLRAAARRPSGSTAGSARCAAGSPPSGSAGWL